MPAGSASASERVRLPLGPPLSFLADPLVPPAPPAVDVWFGFNPLACGRGLVARRQGRAGRVVLWSVDFVPDRFGPGTAPTRIYDRLDRLCCTRADARIELSEAAREARNDRHGLRSRRRARPRRADGRLARPRADDAARRPRAPPGRLPRAPRPAAGRRRPAGGAGAATRSRRRGDGRRDRRRPARRRAARARPCPGPRRCRTLPRLRRPTIARRRLLADASVAVAPYRPPTTRSRAYADPGKLKAYLASGSADRPHRRAAERARARREGGAEIVG